jgi:mycothiol system anti-sigma-R factor
VNCQEALPFVHAYVDGELDLVKGLEIEHHIQECAACSREYQTLTTLRAAMNDDGLYHKAPATLRKSVLAQVQRAERRGVAIRTLPWRWIGTLAAIAAAVVLTFALTRALFVPSSEDLLTQEVIASHVRAEITNHLADVASSDQHTVKPWFNGKLDFSPTVQDLAASGFPLIGGRLDYVDGRPVAALVYRRQQHIINLFIWPSTGEPDTSPQAQTRQGYNLVHWTKGGMTYWAITDLNATEFQQFVHLVQSGS